MGIELVELIISFALTWIIGLIPPLFFRFVILDNKPVSKREALAFVIIFWILNLWILNLILSIAIGSESKTHAALFLIAWVSYWIIRKPAKAEQEQDISARSQASQTRAAQISPAEIKIVTEIAMSPTAVIPIPSLARLDKIVIFLSALWISTMAFMGISDRCISYPLEQFVLLGFMPPFIIGGLYWIIRDTNRSSGPLKVTAVYANLIDGNRVWYFIGAGLLLFAIFCIDIMVSAANYC